MQQKKIISRVFWCKTKMVRQNIASDRLMDNNYWVDFAIIRIFEYSESFWLTIMSIFLVFQVLFSWSHGSSKVWKWCSMAEDWPCVCNVQLNCQSVCLHHVDASLQEESLENIRMWNNPQEIGEITIWGKCDQHSDNVFKGGVRSNVPKIYIHIMPTSFIYIWNCVRNRDTHCLMI